MLNRKQPPPLHTIKDLSIPPYQYKALSNDIPLYSVKMGTQEVFKLEVLFKVGRFHEHAPMVAALTARMMKEGTTRHTAAEIADLLDFYGGTLSSPSSLDTSNFVLYGLTKHLDALLPTFAEVILAPTFPEHELETYVSEKIQELQINLTKNDVVAYRTITEAIFGAKHPYGYNSTPELYKSVQRDDLLQHYHNHFLAKNCTIFLSGNVNQSMVEQVEKHIAARLPVSVSSLPNEKQNTPSPEKHIFIEKPKSLQTAIRLGRRLFNRHHPDHDGLYILNTILGGYFGSRLMMNIREEKGYTYNIYSMMDMMETDGAFIIGTEVGNEYAADTLQQIKVEMQRLCDELVPEEELNMLRNYLMGTLLGYLDGAFNVADMVKSLVTSDLTEAHFKRLVTAILETDATSLRTLAQRYLNLDDFYTVIVGVKDVMR